MLLHAGSFVRGLPTLAVATLVPMGPDMGIAFMTLTPPGVGLATAIDGDMDGCAEAGGPASSHQPFPTT